MKLLAEAGLEVRVLRIPGAKDPDEFMKNNGATAPEKFRRLLDQSRTQFDFKLENVLMKHDISIVDERVKAAAELTRIISEVYSKAERDVYIGVVSAKLEIPRDSIEADVRRAMRDRGREQQKAEMQEIINKTAGYGDRVNPDMVKSTAAVNTEENILGILLLFPEHLAAVRRGKIELTEEDFFSEFNKRVFREALARCPEGGGFDPACLNEIFDPDEMGRITSMSVRRRQLTDNSEELLVGMIEKLRKETKRLNTEGDELSRIADILASKRKASQKG